MYHRYDFSHLPESSSDIDDLIFCDETDPKSER